VGHGLVPVLEQQKTASLRLAVFWESALAWLALASPDRLERGKPVAKEMRGKAFHGPKSYHNEGDATLHHEGDATLHRRDRNEG
jgi:hypothetical protein